MRILHFSDLHFCGGNGYDSSVANITLLCSCLSNIIQDKGIDLVVYSGDLTYKGGSGYGSLTEAFKAFEMEVIDKVTSAIGIEKERFVFVPGNHDTDQRDNKDENAQKTDDELIKWLCNPVELNSFMHRQDLDKQLPRHKEFNQFQNDYYTKYVKAPNTYYHTNFHSVLCLDIDGVMVAVNLINSAWRCFDSQSDNKRLLIGMHQIVDGYRRSQNAQLRIGVSHHHFNDVLEFDRNQIHDEIPAVYDIYLTGHTHTGYTEQIIAPKDKYLSMVTSGMLSDNNYTTEYDHRNSFFILDIDAHSKNFQVSRYIQEPLGNFILDPFFAENGVWIPKPAQTHFTELDKWCKAYKEEEHFISNPVVEGYLNDLRDDSKGNIQLVALSGMGKTRMIYEAFKQYSTDRKCFYADLTYKAEEILSDFECRLIEMGDTPALYVLDNCTDEQLQFVMQKIGGRTNIRILAANNAYQDSTAVNKCHMLKMGRDILKKEVNEYIDQYIPDERYPALNHDIKKYSDGFPSMAIEFVKAAKQSGNIQIETANGLMTKILQYDTDIKKEQTVLMQTASLFQPMPYGKKNNAAYRYILSNNIFTRLYDKVYDERRALMARTINRFSGSLLEVGSVGINVRPFPLAYKLMKDWFSYTDCDAFDDLINDLTQLQQADPEAYTSVRDGFCTRVRYLSENNDAKYIVQELTKQGGNFRSEKVVCSDLGSRLFLALTTVNPVSIVDCLYSVFTRMGIERIKAQICYETRRTYVEILQHLFYDDGAFHKAAVLMGLFSLAENEGWSNNATGQFAQLFHIQLAGTCVDYNGRLDVMRDLYERQMYSLVLKAADSAFNSHGFVKVGGAEKFGTVTRPEYQPQSDDDVYNYWDAIAKLLIGMINDGIALDGILSIISNHAYTWLAEGDYFRIFIPLYTAFVQKTGEYSMSVYADLDNARYNSIKRIYGKEEYEKLEKHLTSIRPPLFYTGICEARNKQNNLGFRSQEDPISVSERLVKVFVADSVYANAEEVRLLMDDDKYIDFAFTGSLVKFLDDDQLSLFLATIVEVLKSKDDDYVCPFVLTVCRTAVGRKSLFDFIDVVNDMGYSDLLIRVLVNCEDKELSFFHRMIIMGHDSEKDVSNYLSYYNINDQEAFCTLEKIVRERYPSLLKLLTIDYLRHRYFALRNPDANTKEVIRNLILEYPLDNQPPRDDFEYSRCVRDYLEAGAESKFVMQIHHKLVEAMSQSYLDTPLKDVYGCILSHYTDLVWDEFIDAFVNTPDSWFRVQAIHSIGTGTGFTDSVFYSLGEVRIKAMCNQYPEKAPALVASLIPIYESMKDTTSAGFHPFLLWLLDNYGSSAEVRNSIHANLNTFAWNGNVLPLFERHLNSFKMLESHPNPDVREWASSCVEDINLQIQDEMDRQELMLMRYGHRL